MSSRENHTINNLFVWHLVAPPAKNDDSIMEFHFGRTIGKTS